MDKSSEKIYLFAVFQTGNFITCMIHSSDEVNSYRIKHQFLNLWHYSCNKEIA